MLNSKFSVLIPLLIMFSAYLPTIDGDSVLAGGQTGEGVRLIFMEPDPAAEKGELTVYRLVSDPEKIGVYRKWVDNEPARMAIELYKRAWQISKKGAGAPIYHIALVPGGNHADIGFGLKGESGTEKNPRVAYIKLAPEEWVFTTTFLHETGHVILSLLNGGDGIPVEDIASIPHTTAALTDRGRAFNEGFAIHLETLAAHLTSDPVVRERYHHPAFLFGLTHQRRSEYYRQSMDLLTYAQTRSRYYDVRENIFAFAPASRDPDYFRVQLDKSRDFSLLRDANQLLQSEGFYATLFFSFLVRGSQAPSIEEIGRRQDRMLAVLAEMFQSRQIRADSPFLLFFAETWMKKFPEDAGEIADVLLDLSHGVFVDRQAIDLWRDHYLAALSLDLAQRNNPKINEARTQWKSRVLADSKVLYANLGPQIRCEVSAVSVKLKAFEGAAPLSFDANTVDEGIMRMIPGMTDAQVNSWLTQKRAQPFRDTADFRARAGLSPAVLSLVK